MKTRIASLAVTITAMSAFLFACKKDDAKTQAPVPSEINERVDEKYLQKIHDLGFDSSGVKNCDSILLVEGSMGISKKFLDTVQVNKIDPNARYGRATNLWTNANGSGHVRIYLPSAITSDSKYYNGAVRAIQEWNGLNSAKSFYALFYTESGYDFQIVFGTLPAGVYAMGDYPGFDTFNGVNGYQIILNKSLIDSQNLSPEQISWLIAHEIGHMMGLRHSDWNTQGEGAYDRGLPIGVVDIPGFTSEADAVNSIMRKNFVPATNDGWTIFNENGKDAAVINALYPKASCSDFPIYPYINLPATGTVATYSNIGVLYPSYRTYLSNINAVQWEIRDANSNVVSSWNDSDISYRFPTNLPKGVYNVFCRIVTSTCTSTQSVKLIQIQ